MKEKFIYYEKMLLQTDASFRIRYTIVFPNEVRNLFGVSKVFDFQ